MGIIHSDSYSSHELNTLEEMAILILILIHSYSDSISICKPSMPLIYWSLESIFLKIEFIWDFLIELPMESRDNFAHIRSRI